MKKFNLHMISDSTGETVGSVARAALAQFDDAEPEEYSWTLVRTRPQMEKVLASIRDNPGPVMYTLVDDHLRDMLKMECAKRGLPCIAVISTAVAELSLYLDMKIHALPGRQHELNENYFTRVDAINYALAHDDGQGHWDIDAADIVLVGVSRTSKSPTCMYLAYKGLKSANIPFVLDCPLPPMLEQLHKPLVVGLTIDPERLQQIRRTRLQSLKQEDDTNYVDMERLQQEIAESRKLFSRCHWPVIDVTRRSVEETAATIIQHLKKHQEKRGEAVPDAS
ncbi:MAG: kinase/pyrophosphorylase [Pseudomonadota bacterium]|nr:kinase/pyrophosphorylase [Pseudomonadota bacterium]MDE3038349.1 kinase/pyrophosphorylase [Pseudomonadota bacterium]